MEWIEEIGRQNGRLVAKAVTRDGDRHVVPLAEIQPPTKEFAVHRRKISTDFGSWSPASSGEYLAGLNFTAEVTEGHRVFAFTHNGARYLVPSLVLMRAFFRPLPHNSRNLFAPQGLAQTAIFQMEGSKFVIQELSCLQVNHKYNATLQALSWYWCFPSAHDCWHSVYAHAAKGNLSIDLPTGNMNCIVHGTLSGSVFRVVSLTVLDVETTEEPFQYAASHPRIIEFRDKVGKSTRHASHDPLILRCGGGWALSDAEWATLRPHIAPNKPHHNQQYELRKIVDFVIEKVGSGKTWRSSSSDSVSWNLAQHHYRKWCIDGRWDHVRSILIQLRGN